MCRCWWLWVLCGAPGLWRTGADVWMGACLRSPEAFNVSTGVMWLTDSSALGQCISRSLLQLGCTSLCSHRSVSPWEATEVWSTGGAVSALLMKLMRVRVCVRVRAQVCACVCIPAQVCVCVCAPACVCVPTPNTRTDNPHAQLRRGARVCIQTHAHTCTRTNTHAHARTHARIHTPCPRAWVHAFAGRLDAGAPDAVC